MNACNYFSGLHRSISSDCWTCVEFSFERNQVRESCSKAGRVFGTLGSQKRSSTWQQRVCCSESVSSKRRPCQGATAQTTAMREQEGNEFCRCVKSIAWRAAGGQLQVSCCECENILINMPAVLRSRRFGKIWMKVNPQEGSFYEMCWPQGRQTSGLWASLGTGRACAFRAGAYRQRENLLALICSTAKVNFGLLFAYC